VHGLQLYNEAREEGMASEKRGAWVLLASVRKPSPTACMSNFNFTYTLW